MIALANGDATRLITGDCVDVMRAMEPESIGMTLTSPPYNVGLNYDGFDDQLTDEQHREFSRRWLSELYRVTQDTGRLYAVISDRMLWWFREEAESVGWTFAQLLVWCKPNFVGMAGKVTGDWNYMTENILLFRRGARTPMLNGAGVTTHNWHVDVIPQSNHIAGRIHPAQMPISLCEKIISRTPGDPVFDPFAGSGSVLVAAKRLGRSYLGIELVEAVAERARLRLSRVNPPLMPQTLEEQADLPLFSDPR